MRRVHWALIALVAIAWPLSGCKEKSVVEKAHAATLKESGQPGIMVVHLEPMAEKRLGIETTPVREETMTLATGAVTRKVIPYGAIMYDKKGDTWTYTNPEPQAYVRQHIVIEQIDGDRVILAEGPPTGTAVVTVGASGGMGAEHKYGH